MKNEQRVPRQLGMYRLIEFIGRGGMGEVWLAIDLRIEKARVLKVLRPRFARDPRYRQQFFRSAEITAGLGYGRIVPVLDYGEAEGHLYLVMMFVDGVNLGEFCRVLAENDEPLGLGAVGFIIGEVFEALWHAHTHIDAGKLRAVIHRDVTPSNVLISSRGEVFLTDFGIAHYEADITNEAIGTLHYMAPEQAQGRAGVVSDVYGAAGVLHFMLTGRAPRQVRSVEELTKCLRDGPPPVGREDVPEPLEHLRRRGLEPDPEERLSSADGLKIVARWPGYWKATQLLANLYQRLVGPPRSGVTGALLAACEAVVAEGRTRSAAVAQEPELPRGSGRMTVKVAKREAGREATEDEAGEGEGVPVASGAGSGGEPLEGDAEGVPGQGDELPGELDDGKEDDEWSRPWWRDEDEPELEPLDSSVTQRYLPPQDSVEPDAPRMLRRPHRRPLDPPIDRGPFMPEAQ